MISKKHPDAFLRNRFRVKRIRVFLFSGMDTVLVPYRYFAMMGLPSSTPSTMNRKSLGNTDGFM